VLRIAPIPDDASAFVDDVVLWVCIIPGNMRRHKNDIGRQAHPRLHVRARPDPASHPNGPTGYRQLGREFITIQVRISPINIGMSNPVHVSRDTTPPKLWGLLWGQQLVTAMVYLVAVSNVPADELG
jgi:hypothetical protein